MAQYKTPKALLANVQRVLRIDGARASFGFLDVVQRLGLALGLDALCDFGV
jgi:hypothetical protein